MLSRYQYRRYESQTSRVVLQENDANQSNVSQSAPVLYSEFVHPLAPRLPGINLVSAQTAILIDSDKNPRGRQRRELEPTFLTSSMSAHDGCALRAIVESLSGLETSQNGHGHCDDQHSCPIRYGHALRDDNIGSLGQERRAAAGRGDGQADVIGAGAGVRVDRILFAASRAAVPEVP